MRRRLMVTCCWAMAGLATGAPSARADLRIEAPPTARTGETITVAVTGTAPAFATLYWSTPEGGVCDDDGWTGRRRVGGTFRETFEVTGMSEGPMALCARIVGPGADSDAPPLDRGMATLELRRPVFTLGLRPVRAVVGTDERVQIRVTGQSETMSGIWGWARPIDGDPCHDIPRIGEQAYGGRHRGAVNVTFALDPIPVPGTYRVCGQVFNGYFSPELYGVIETQVIVSQACTEARHALARRTASYRRARAAHRRARGARRARTRRVLLQRGAALDRARARVRAVC